MVPSGSVRNPICGIAKIGHVIRNLPTACPPRAAVPMRSAGGLLGFGGGGCPLAFGELAFEEGVGRGLLTGGVAEVAKQLAGL